MAVAKDWRVFVPVLLGIAVVTWFLLRPDPNRVPTYPVRGRVVFEDGSPVRTGRIELESSQFGTSATGRINDDGSFVLGTYESEDGATAGSHSAIIVQVVIDDGTIVHVKDHGKPVAQKFSRYETSGLSIDIEPIEQNDIVVTVQAKKTRAGN